MTLPSEPAADMLRQRESRGRSSQAMAAARAVVVVLIAALGSLAMSGTAQAHTDITSSEPAAGETLRLPPALVRLNFNEAINKDFANLTLTVGTRDPVAVRAEVIGSTVTADVPATVRSTTAQASQRWRLAYRVVSVDGHPVTGSVTFSVAAPPGASRPSPSASQSDAAPAPETQSPADADGDRNVRITELSDPGANAWVPTAVIGLITASALGVALVWLVRGRRRDQRE